MIWSLLSIWTAWERRWISLSFACGADWCCNTIRGLEQGEVGKIYCLSATMFIHHKHLPQQTISPSTWKMLTTNIKAFSVFSLLYVAFMFLWFQVQEVFNFIVLTGNADEVSDIYTPHSPFNFGAPAKVEQITPFLLGIPLHNSQQRISPIFDLRSNQSGEAKTSVQLCRAIRIHTRWDGWL